MTLSMVSASGSVTGRAHRLAERDSQDGHARVTGERVVAGIVTDGCGSGRASEVGARIGAEWLAALIEQRFAAVADEAGARAAANDVTSALLARLRVLACSLDADGEVRAARVEAMLLFTFLAAVVTPATAIVFGVGDGSVMIGERVTVIDPGPHNAPPYVAYGLLGAALAPCIHFVGSSDDIGVLAVATDGLDPTNDLPALAADPRYVRNPSLLRKRLVVLSDAGRCVDDATIAVIRRREVAS